MKVIATKNSKILTKYSEKPNFAIIYFSSLLSRESISPKLLAKIAESTGKTFCGLQLPADEANGLV